MGVRMVDYEEWLLEVSHFPGIVAFVPFLRDKNSVVSGLAFISDRPPRGRVVGLFSLRGKEHLEEVEARYPMELDRAVKIANGEVDVE